MESGLLQKVAALLRSWYVVDRIRLDPTAGRLVSIQPGNRLLFGEALFMVDQRSSVENTAGGFDIEYRLDDEGDDASLQVVTNQEHEVVTAELTRREQTIAVDEESVFVLS